MEAKIKPQDLKLNNFVIYNYKGNDEVCIVDSIQEHAIECRFVNGMREDLTTGIITAPEHLIGVPLSEDWLRRMGFVECYRSDYTIKFEHPKSTYLEYIFRNRDRVKAFRYYNYEIKCETVHQLQNLFYSLTGSELTIKDINNIEVK